MSYQYGSIPLSVRLQGFNLFQGSTQTFRNPVPANAYNQLALKRHYTAYPKLKESEPLKKYISLSSGSTLTWQKPIPANEYNGGSFKSANKPYPRFKPFKLIMPSDSADAAAAAPAAKKYSMVEILAALEQQFPGNERIKALRRDMVLLEIAKQSRPLTSDEINLENSIKKEVEALLAKPSEPPPVQPSAIPPSGEQPPESAEIITDADRKIISELGIEDDNDAKVKLANKILKADNVKKSINQWENEFKKYSSLINEDVDIEDIKEGSLRKAIKAELKDLIINNDDYGIDVKEARDVYKNTMKDANNLDSRKLIKLLNQIKYRKRKALEEIDEKRDEAIQAEEVLKKDIEKTFAELDKKEAKIRKKLSEAETKKEKTKLKKDLNELKQERMRFKKEISKLPPPPPPKKSPPPPISVKPSSKPPKKPSSEPPKQSSPEPPKKSSSLSEPPKKSSSLSEPPKSEPVLAEEEEKEEYKPIKTTEIEKDYNELVKLIKSKSKNTDEIKKVADRLGFSIPNISKSDLLDNVYDQVIEDEVLDAYIPMLIDKTNATGKRRMTKQDIIEFAKSDLKINVPEEGKQRKDIVEYIETDISKKIIYRDTGVRIPERITTMKDLEDYYGKPMAKA